MSSIKEMNRSLYNASIHLTEAGKYLSNVEGFRPYAATLLKMADDLAGIIQPEELKVSEEKMKDILDEIMDFGEEDGKTKKTKGYQHEIRNFGKKDVEKETCIKTS